jgi:hypothetical protein
VQNRAARDHRQEELTHHGFLIAPSSDAALATVVEQLVQLGRVEATLVLGVIE